MRINKFTFWKWWSILWAIYFMIVTVPKYYSEGMTFEVKFGMLVIASLFIMAWVQVRLEKTILSIEREIEAIKRRTEAAKRRTEDLKRRIDEARRKRGE